MVWVWAEGGGEERRRVRRGLWGGTTHFVCMKVFFIELSAMYVIGSVHKWGCVILLRISLPGPLAALLALQSCGGRQ